MKTKKLNKYHTDIICENGTISVNTRNGIQLIVRSEDDMDFSEEVFIDIRCFEAEELVRILKDAILF